MSWLKWLEVSSKTVVVKKSGNGNENKRICREGFRNTYRWRILNATLICSWSRTEYLHAINFWFNNIEAWRSHNLTDLRRLVCNKFLNELLEQSINADYRRWWQREIDWRDQSLRWRISPWLNQAQLLDSNNCKKANFIIFSYCSQIE